MGTGEPISLRRKAARGLIPLRVVGDKVKTITWKREPSSTTNARALQPCAAPESGKTTRKGDSMKISLQWPKALRIFATAVIGTAGLMYAARGQEPDRPNP